MDELMDGWIDLGGCDLPNSVGLQNEEKLLRNRRTPEPKANPTREKLGEK